MMLTKTTRNREEVACEPQDIKLTTFMNCDQCLHSKVCKWKDRCTAQQTQIVIPTGVPILQISMEVECAEFIKLTECSNSDESDKINEGDE